MRTRTLYIKDFLRLQRRLQRVFYTAEGSDSGRGSVMLLRNFKLDPTQAEAVTCSVSRHVLLAFLVAAASLAAAGWPVYCFGVVMLHGDA